MRNTVMLVIMALVYAVGSDTDYSDAQLMHEAGKLQNEQLACATSYHGCMPDKTEALVLSSR